MSDFRTNDWRTSPSRAVYDFAVIGGGIVGMSIAWELGRRCRHAKTLLVTEQRAPLSASAAAGVMLSGFAETTVLTHAATAGTAKAKLRLDGAHAWPEWLANANGESRADPVTLQGDTVVILNSVGGTLDERNFNAILAELDAAGAPYEEIAPLDLPFRPAPNGRPLRAINIPAERWLDGTAVLRALASALARLPSVEVVHATATAITADVPSGRCTVAVGHQRVEAGETVVAAGYRTSLLL